MIDVSALQDASGGEHLAGAKAAITAAKGAVAAKSQFVQAVAQPLSAIDTNHDGVLDYHDCPYQPGSKEAINWFNTVMSPFVKAQATPEMKAKYGEKLAAMYNGKAIISNAPTADGGDFQYLIQKLILTKGMTPESATTFAAKVKATEIARFAEKAAAVQ